MQYFLKKSASTRSLTDKTKGLL